MGPETVQTAPVPRRKRGGDYVPAIGPRLRVLLFVIFAGAALLGASGVYMLSLRILEWRQERLLQTPSSLLVVLIHVLVGVAFIVPFLIFGATHLITARKRPNRLAVRLGVCLFISGLIVVLSGVALIRLAGLPNLPEYSGGWWIAWGLHVGGPVVAVVFYVLHRRAGPEIRWRWGYGWGLAVAVFVGAMIYSHSLDPRRWHAKGSPEGERYFEPASSRTVNGNFIPARALLMDEYCLKCHPDIYNSHIHSAHRFSSFSNPAYLFSVQETRLRVGTRASRWCAGCHDPGPFFSGSFEDPRTYPDFDPVRDKERLDLFLEVDDVLNKRKSALDSPISRAGITCITCHGMTHINSRSGNGDYTIEEPEQYPFAFSDNPVLQWLNNQLIKAKPDFHKKTFLKPFHRTSDFCSTCHKVGVPLAVNHYKEFLRGQDHADTHLLSGAASGARSFYYPPKGKRCADCHMPLMASNDFGRQDFDGSGTRKVHSHIFLGANTGVPALVKYPGWEQVVEEHRKFLQGGLDGKTPALRLDLFGLKQVQSDAAGTAERGVSAPLLGNASLRPQLPALQPGATYLVEVVIRTVGMGHPFTQGTVDSNEVWVEFTAKSGNKILGRSGMMAGDDEGPVDEGSHFINVLMLDRNGNRIDRRNPQDIFTPLYNHQIPPGAAAVVHYRLRLPHDIKAPVELSARVRYRKFDYTYMEKVHGKGKVPRLPIVDLCSDRVVLPVAGVAAKVPEQPSPIKPAWQRWNDYGIACFLEGGPEGKAGGELGAAEDAFRRLTGPEFPEAQAHGWLNLARVHLAYGGSRLTNAAEALDKARKCKPPAPWWTVAWFSGLVNLQNAHLEEAAQDFETILDPKNQDRKRQLDLTKDYIVINELGKTLFLLGESEVAQGHPQEAAAYFEQAIARFERTLELNAESEDAHEFLNKCYGRLAIYRFAPVRNDKSSDGGAPGSSVKKFADELVAASQAPTDRSAAVSVAKSLLRSLTDHRQLPLATLVAVREQAYRAAKGTRDRWLRLAITPILNQTDRLILAALPGEGKILADTGETRQRRLEAARLLTQALIVLGQPAPAGDVEPSLATLASWPAAGPVPLALAGLAERGVLAGPMREPRILALTALRQQVRPVFAGKDADLRGAAALVLSRLHLILHEIYKPDEHATGRAQQIYRQRHPLADRASQTIVIYDLK
jgi:tetratricopeptide (TPR) repeat protein